MKLLAFTPGHATTFGILYAAGLTDHYRPTSAERRTLGKLLDRFDAVSSAGAEEGSRLLCEGGADVVIDDAEHALLLKMFDAAPWRPIHTRDVNAAEDFLKAAPEYTPPPNPAP
jgi:hypothetical protein